MLLINQDLHGISVWRPQGHFSVLFLGLCKSRLEDNAGDSHKGSCLLSIASKNSNHVSGLSDGATITYFCLFHLLPVKFGTSSCEQWLTELLLLDSFWEFLIFKWCLCGLGSGLLRGFGQHRLMTEKGCCCFDEQLWYDCVINIFPLCLAAMWNSLWQKNTLPPAQTKEPAMAQMVWLKVKSLQHWLEAFQHLQLFMSIWVLLCVFDLSSSRLFSHNDS